MIVANVADRAKEVFCWEACLHGAGVGLLWQHALFPYRPSMKTVMKAPLFIIPNIALWAWGLEWLRHRAEVQKDFQAFNYLVAKAMWSRHADGMKAGLARYHDTTDHHPYRDIAERAHRRGIANNQGMVKTH